MNEYIYILINPSLAGLLKIGRTSRSPEERAIELSKGTNMPTPFIVAYEEEVPDSKIAEKLIHDELTEQGFRVNDSREFFSIPLKIAIQVAARVAQNLRESTANSKEYLSEINEEKEFTGDYYFQQGIYAMHGSEEVLQDYKAAREFFEKAIALGCIQAHIFLAYLYIGGNGVRQSHDSALKILKAGGEKGDPECFKVMWDIYSGNTVLDARNEGNAELCFQWYLEASNSEVDSAAFEDYLDHSYEILGGDVNTWGDKKFPISQFPGRFAPIVIELWIKKIQKSFLEVKKFRLLDTSSKQTESPPISPASDLITLKIFLSNCVQDEENLMRQALQGVKEEDLNYIFSKTENPQQIVRGYTPYISTSPKPPEKEFTQNKENNTPDPISVKKSNNFLNWLLDKMRFF